MWSKLCLFILSFVCITMFCNAQTPASTSTRDGSSYDIATNSALGFGKRHNISLDDMDGDPFFFDDYVLGNALLANGLLDDSLLLKYNLATKSFLTKLEDDTQIIINDRNVLEFRLYNNGEEFLFKRVDPEKPREFYEIIYEGQSHTLYKREDVKIVEGQELGISKTNHRIFREVRYYMRNGMEIQRVKLKKKLLWKYFDSKQQRILNEYLSQNKIKLKKEKDFKKLFSILKK